MAGVFSKQRFGFASETTIEELKIFSKNPNTVKSTSFWLNVWESWCKQKDIVNKIEENEREKLNKLLETFYAEVKNKNGDDCEPDSLKVMIAALDRHLNDEGYKFSIIRDREFHSSKQVLEGKARQLRQSGMGKRPNKARSLTEEEEEVLWEAEKFGSKTPEALTSSMWWLLTQFFGLRGRQEHHAMKMEDFLWRGILDKNVIESYCTVYCIVLASLLSYRNRYASMSYAVMLYRNRNTVLS